MARTAKEILAEIGGYRAQNRALYSMLEEDKTLEMVAKAYAWDEAKAKEWHQKVVANDKKILKLSEELCGLDASSKRG